MATLKLVQRSDKINEKGEAPIFLRVIHKRKTNFIRTKEFSHCFCFATKAYEKKNL